MTASPRESGLFRRYMSARNPVRKNLQAFQPTKVIARTVRAAADARTEPGEIGCCARTRQKGGRRPLQHEDPRVWMAYTMYGYQAFHRAGHLPHLHPGGGDHADPTAWEACGSPPLGLPVRAKKRSTRRHKTPEASGPPCGGQHAPLPTMSRLVSRAMCVQRRCLS
jgi:hypothetical protein